MARVLIAGCGYVGSALASELVAGGDEVFGVTRSGRDLPPGVAGIRADLTEASSLGALPPAVELVFYTAAAGASTEEAYEAAYVRGPRTLLEVLAARGDRPRRVLFTSSTGVYGRGNGEWVDEETTPEPRQSTARVLLAGETAVREGPFPVTVVRFAGIYGPGRTRTIEAVRSGAMGLVDGPPEYTNRIHRDDCALVLAHLARQPAPDSLYLGVDDEPATRNDVVRFLAQELGVPLAAPRRTGPGTGSNRRCSNARLLSTGYRFRYPTYREGYRALLAR